PATDVHAPLDRWPAGTRRVPRPASATMAGDRKPRASRMSRYFPYIACVILTLFSAWMALQHPAWRWPLGIFGALALLGTWDMLQTRTTLRRNYPILAHFRYALESIGPEMRQYFIQDDMQEVPFSRRQR